MKQLSIDLGWVDKIIDIAEGYMHMSNASDAEQSFGRAAKEFLVDKDIKQDDWNKTWGKYKKVSKDIYLKRQKELLGEATRDKMLRGAQEAAWARKDKEVLDAEANEEEISELRSSYLNLKK